MTMTREDLEDLAKARGVGAHPIITARGQKRPQPGIWLARLAQSHKSARVVTRIEMSPDP
eukprot:1319965-Karenia_brevis.AAC.1